MDWRNIVIPAIALCLAARLFCYQVSDIDMIGSDRS